jgi:hypothetical protein
MKVQDDRSDGTIKININIIRLLENVLVLVDRGVYPANAMCAFQALRGGYKI